MRYILFSKIEGFRGDVDPNLLDKDPNILNLLKPGEKKPSLVTNRLPYVGLGVVPVADTDYEEFAKLGWPLNRLYFDRKSLKLEMKKLRNSRVIVANCTCCGASLAERKEKSKFAQYCSDCLVEKRRERSRKLINNYRKDPDFKIEERYKILGIYYASKGKPHAYATIEDYAKYLYDKKGIKSKWVS